MKLHTNIVSLFLVMSCLQHAAYGSQHKTSEQEKQRNELALEKAYHDDNYPEFLRLLSRGARGDSTLWNIIEDSEGPSKSESKYAHKLRKQLSKKELNHFFTMAGCRGKYDIMKTLLRDKRVDLNLADEHNKGNTLLMYIVQGSYKAEKIAPMLIYLGASTTIQNNAGQTVFHRARSQMRLLIGDPTEQEKREIRCDTLRACKQMLNILRHAEQHLTYKEKKELDKIKRIRSNT